MPSAFSGLKREGMELKSWFIVGLKFRKLISLECLESSVFIHKPCRGIHGSQIRVFW